MSNRIQVKTDKRAISSKRKANIDLKRALKKLPIHEIRTKADLKKFFNDK